MSFILDALKKAESERNRRVAPVLMDARIAPPRRGLPAWAWALGGILLVNLALLGWLALRQPATPPATSASAAPTLQTDAAPTQPAPLPAGVADQAAMPAPAGDSAPAQGAPPSPAIELPRAPPRAVAPAPARTSIDEDRLPGIHELRAAGVALPELQLNLLVYDPAPAERAVLLNGQRAREGEYLPNGVKVERITPEGVVLEAGGRRFRLTSAD